MTPSFAPRTQSPKATQMPPEYPPIRATTQPASSKQSMSACFGSKLWRIWIKIKVIIAKTLIMKTNYSKLSLNQPWLTRIQLRIQALAAIKASYRLIISTNNPTSWIWMKCHRWRLKWMGRRHRSRLHGTSSNSPATKEISKSQSASRLKTPRKPTKEH